MAVPFLRLKEFLRIFKFNPYTPLFSVHEVNGDGKPFTCFPLVRQMGLNFENLIHIHQVHSHCRELFLPLRQDVPERTD